MANLKIIYKVMAFIWKKWNITEYNYKCVFLGQLCLSEYCHQMEK